jgi:hypothetical protein
MSNVIRSSTVFDGYDDDYKDNNWEEKFLVKGWFERDLCPECHECESSDKYFPLCCVCHYKRNKKQKQQDFNKKEAVEID